MKALLDTNIIIHREARTVVKQDIGILFRWLDRAKYIKCIHPVTIQEIKKNPNTDTVRNFMTKIESYEHLELPTPLQEPVEQISKKIDVTENDYNDTLLLNEVFAGRVDILITEDKKMHDKASLLNIADKVFRLRESGNFKLILNY
jgi:predicted nucleic acid-binding protein